MLTQQRTDAARNGTVQLARYATVAGVLGRAAALLLAFSGAIHAAALPANPYSYSRTSRFEYHPVTGALTVEVIEPDNLELCARTDYAYEDAYGNKTKATISNCDGSSGAALFATRDSKTEYGTNTVNLVPGQYPTRTVNALSQSETREYDPRFGTITKSTSPNGLSTTWQYDTFGRKILETRADGTRTSWSYYYCSNVACPASTNPLAWYVETTPQNSSGGQNGPKSRAYYDIVGREVMTQSQGFDGTFIEILKEYDALGRLARVSAPHFVGGALYWTRYFYDETNRVVREERADPAASGGVAVSTIAYNGLTVRSTNALGQTVTQQKNSQGQLIRVTDHLGSQIASHYDAFGNLLRTTDLQQNQTRMTYDIRGRKVTIDDPDMGTWTYVYNALGEVTSNIDAELHVITMQYDLLGRKIAQLAPGLNSYWSYDKYADGSACFMGIGKLCETYTDHDYRRKESYDSLGRPSVTSVTSGTTYVSKVAYNSDGQPQQSIWPTGFAIRYSYNAMGYLYEINNAVSGPVYWRGLKYDARGQVVEQLVGNGAQTLNSYEPATGRLERTLVNVTRSGSVVGSVFDQRYGYDALSNLLSRTDAQTNVIETFGYDNLNRFTSQTVTTGSITRSPVIWGYDEVGNVRSQSEVGSYSYNQSGGAGPHAVTGIAGTQGAFVNPSYVYDNNGNIKTVLGAGGVRRDIEWNGFNRPTRISNQAGTSVTFAYDSGYDRVREEFARSVNGVTLRRTVTQLHPAGSLYFESEKKEDGSYENRHYVAGALLVKSTSASDGIAGDPTPVLPPGTQIQYLHKDHLGSTALVTDANVAVVERLAYDPFGKRRFTSGAFDAAQTLVAQTTPRGFTGHEHLEDFGLVHMNGRIFDAGIGRFLSPDSYVQFPDNLQSYNRYSYLLNNPLNGTDPTGHFSLKKAVGAIFGGTNLIAWKSGNAAMQSVLSHVSYATGSRLVALGSFLCGPGAPACAAMGSYNNARAHGATSSDALRAGAISGATAYAMRRVGTLTNGHNVTPQYFMTADHMANMAGHALVGCASAAASGGDCGAAAASGAVGSFFTPLSAGAGDVGGFAISVAAGGLASAAAGGTFGDGLLTASYGYLFNNLFTVGGRFRIPLLWGGSAALGVSYNQGQWDAGIVLQGDLPGLNMGNLLLRGGVDVGYQPGDFDSARGQQSLSIEGHRSGIGGSVQVNAVTKEFDGATITFGPGMGGSVSAVSTNTISVRQVYREIIAPAADWVVDRAMDAAKNVFRPKPDPM